MNLKRSRYSRAGILIAVTLLVGDCAMFHHHHDDPDAGSDQGINIEPTNYKSDILAAMQAYLNDPTGIRDAVVSAPMLKSVGDDTRYVVCVRFNGKQNGNTYAGVREVAAIFLAGHLDRFLEAAHEQCAEAIYTPFPELGKLPR
jgi:hypothetical protein